MLFKWITLGSSANVAATTDTAPAPVRHARMEAKPRGKSARAPQSGSMRTASSDSL